MPRYHMNIHTGNPGVCKAKIQCPFGDLVTEHYDSREEAQFFYEQKMLEKTFPSFDKGKINIKKLPAEMRIDDDTIVVPKGVYVIGDPAFSLIEDPGYSDDGDNEAWNDWIDTISNEEGSFNRGAVGAMYNNYPVVGLTVNLGPGTYRDSFNRHFEINTGIVSVVPLSLLKKMGMDATRFSDDTTIVSFDEATTLHRDGDFLKFGDHFQLLTDEPVSFEDEYEDEFEDEEEDNVDDYVNNNDWN